jgi:hypothetical protein
MESGIVLSTQNLKTKLNKYDDRHYTNYSYHPNNLNTDFPVS